MFKKPLNILQGIMIRPRTAQAAAVVLCLLILATLAFAIGRRFRAAPGETTASSAATETNSGAGPLSALENVPAAAFERGSTLEVGADDALSIINPLYSTGDGELDAVSLIFESLVRLNSQGDPLAVLARTWSYDLAARQLTVTLRSDHTFRDGRTAGIEDVLFTYQCLLSSSYDGSVVGRLGEVLSVAAGKTSNTVVFQMADWVTEPDFGVLTIGILNADYYATTPDQVREIRDKNLPPEGSGAWQVASLQSHQIILELRDGFVGQIRTIRISQVRSDQKYQLLQQGELDVTRNLWDSRMQLRADTLPGYTFCPFRTRVDQYLLVNPLPVATSIIQRPSQRLAVLLQAAGKPISELQKSALAELEASANKLHLYYFHGAESSVLYDNRKLAEMIAASLRAAGLEIELTASAWPDLAKRAATYDYDILLMPATANNRLPDLSVVMQDPVQPDASAWVVNYRPEAFIISNRLSGLTINPSGRSCAASAATWTDNLESVKLLHPDGTRYEEKIP